MSTSSCTNFNPRSPCGERRPQSSAPTHPPYFNPRSPCGERRRENDMLSLAITISIHALLAESDQAMANSILAAVQFQSTLSLRRATPSSVMIQLPASISIHALLAESDSTVVLLPSATTEISIHALLAESDGHAPEIHRRGHRFQSTLSLRRATTDANSRVVEGYISIHALLAESDRYRDQNHLSRGISIHALLAESDATEVSRDNTPANFNPRSPCGERRGGR